MNAPPSPGSDLGNDLTRAFARCFRGTDGERVLAHLRRLTLERRLSPDCSEAALRHLEGQRHLVAYIGLLAERGRLGTGAWAGARDGAAAADIYEAS